MGEQVILLVLWYSGSYRIVQVEIQEDSSFQVDGQQGTIDKVIKKSKDKQ